MPNHPKKHRKKVIQVIWNARMGVEEKSSRFILVALFDIIYKEIYVNNT